MKPQDQHRYQRQMQLIGEAGQQKLSQAKVLIVGMGGLGNAVLPVLVGAGVGTIGIMDGDSISLSNLHRQPLFTEEDLGELKVEIAGKVMSRLNPGIDIQPISQHLSGHNALEIFPNYDIIVDATDRVSVRYLMDHAAVLCHKPFVHAALYRFQAQVSVFNFQQGPGYRCLYPDAPKEVKACDEVGVLGATVSLAGSLQANEVLKMILGIGEVASGKLLVIDGLTNQIQTFSFQKNPEVSTSLQGFHQLFQQPAVPTISLQEALDQRLILLDVREAHESPILNHDFIRQIPLSQLDQHWQDIDPGTAIAIFCQSGTRAGKAWEQLRAYGKFSLYCLHEQAESIAQFFSHEEAKNRIH